jgi:hypothetical protein
MQQQLLLRATPSTAMLPRQPGMPRLQVSQHTHVPQVPLGPLKCGAGGRVGAGSSQQVTAAAAHTHQHYNQHQAMSRPIALQGPMHQLTSHALVDCSACSPPVPPFCTP